MVEVPISIRIKGSHSIWGKDNEKFVNKLSKESNYKVVAYKKVNKWEQRRVVSYYFMWKIVTYETVTNDLPNLCITLYEFNVWSPAGDAVPDLLLPSVLNTVVHRLTAASRTSFNPTRSLRSISLTNKTSWSTRLLMTVHYLYQLEAHIVCRSSVIHRKKVRKWIWAVIPVI